MLTKKIFFLLLLLLYHCPIYAATIIGQEETGDSGSYGSSIYSTVFESVKKGTITGGKIYTNSSKSTKVKLLVYDYGTDSLLAQSDEISSVTTGWNDLTFSGANQITISDVSQYRVCFWTDTWLDHAKSGGGSHAYYTYSYGDGTPPANWSESGVSNSKVNVYLTGAPIYDTNSAIITSTTGSVSTGSVLTIEGSGFGTRVDNGGSESYLNFKWDNFEGGALNDTYDGGGVDLTTSGQRVNSTYCVSKQTNGGAMDNGLGVNSSSTNEGYYTSFYVKRPVGHTITDTDAQCKMVRISNSTGYPNVTLGKQDFSLTIPGQHIITVEGNPGYTQYLGYNTYYNDNLWHRMVFWFKPSTGVGNADGICRVWLDENRVFASNLVTTHSDAKNTYDQYWKTLTYNISQSKPLLQDDIYFDYTQSRIEIGNNSVFELSDRTEIQIPTVWSNTSIQVVINLGEFTETDNNYLFIIDSNGVASEGYALFGFGARFKNCTLKNIDITR